MQKLATEEMSGRVFRIQCPSSLIVSVSNFDIRLDLSRVCDGAFVVLISSLANEPNFWIGICREDESPHENYHWQLMYASSFPDAFLDFSLDDIQDVMSLSHRNGSSILFVVKNRGLVLLTVPPDFHLTRKYEVIHVFEGKNIELFKCDDILFAKRSNRFYIFQIEDGRLKKSTGDLFTFDVKAWPKNTKLLSIQKCTCKDDVHYFFLFATKEKRTILLKKAIICEEKSAIECISWCSILVNFEKCAILGVKNDHVSLFVWYRGNFKIVVVMSEVDSKTGKEKLHVLGEWKSSNVSDRRQDLPPIPFGILLSQGSCLAMKLGHMSNGDHVRRIPILPTWSMALLSSVNDQDGAVCVAYTLELWEMFMRNRSIDDPLLFLMIELMAMEGLTLHGLGTSEMDDDADDGDDGDKDKDLVDEMFDFRRTAHNIFKEFFTGIIKRVPHKVQIKAAIGILRKTEMAAWDYILELFSLNENISALDEYVEAVPIILAMKGREKGASVCRKLAQDILQRGSYDQLSSLLRFVEPLWTDVLREEWTDLLQRHSQELIEKLQFHRFCDLVHNVPFLRVSEIIGSIPLGGRIELEKECVEMQGQFRLVVEKVNGQFSMMGMLRRWEMEILGEIQAAANEIGWVLLEIICLITLRRMEALEAILESCDVDLVDAVMQLTQSSVPSIAEMVRAIQK
jgi:hypothetical protein